MHELFHFVWARLGNATRRSWEELLQREFRLKSHGELGWSSEKMKLNLSPGDVAGRSRRWREYACESFCDSAGWFFAREPHEEYTLAASFRHRRRLWLADLLARGPVPV